MRKFNKLLKTKNIDEKWGVELMQHINKLDEGLECSKIKTALSEILCEPKAISHPQWFELMIAAIKTAPDFEDVAELVYDERVSFLDDEGWLCQGFEEYQTIEEVAEVLTTKEALKHPQWIDLALELFDKSMNLEHQMEFCESIIIPAIEAGNSNWKQLVEKVIANDPEDFILYCLDQPEVLDAPELLTWVKAVGNYRTLLSVLLEESLISSDKWFDIITICKDLLYKDDDEYIEIMEIYESKK